MAFQSMMAPKGRDEAHWLAGREMMGVQPAASASNSRRLAGVSPAGAKQSAPRSIACSVTAISARTAVSSFRILPTEDDR
eukprot:scaffold128223_cov75-Phaeocystis_antarctica.AAC.2